MNDIASLIKKHKYSDFKNGGKKYDAGRK